MNKRTPSEPKEIIYVSENLRASFQKTLNQLSKEDQQKIKEQIDKLNLNMKITLINKKH